MQDSESSCAAQTLEKNYKYVFQGGLCQTKNKVGVHNLDVIHYILEGRPLRNQLPWDDASLLDNLTLFLRGENIHPHLEANNKKAEKNPTAQVSSGSACYSTVSVQSEWQLHHPRDSHIPPSRIQLPGSSEQTFPDLGTDGYSQPSIGTTVDHQQPALP